MSQKGAFIVSIGYAQKHWRSGLRGISLPSLAGRQGIVVQFNKQEQQLKRLLATACGAGFASVYDENEFPVDDEGVSEELFLAPVIIITDHFNGQVKPQQLTSEEQEALMSLAPNVVALPIQMTRDF